ncbi:MAG: nitroreductase family protein [candidate division WOR-3 bacterium]|nr:nitroreductase family protein [candidate division WOR-3 bacterium]
MDVEKAIRERRSVRAYKDKEIPEKDLKKVLEAARLAPSASNRQSWKFVVVRDKRRKRELAIAAAGQDFIGKAPIVIAAVALEPEHVMRCEVPAYAVDLAIAIDHMTLQAVELGLGTCWIGAFYQDQVKKILEIPEKYKVVVLLPIGYPATGKVSKIRKSLKEIICYETFK